MLTVEVQAFLKQGLDVQLSTRDANLRPHGVRIVALRVDEDAAHVDAFAPEVGATAVLANLDANGRAALMCSRPSDNRTLQLKGAFVSSRPATSAEQGFVAEQWAKLEEDLTHLGLPLGLLGSWTTWPSVVIRVRVEQVFEQTPGPGAGAAIA